MSKFVFAASAVVVLVCAQAQAQTVVPGIQIFSSQSQASANAFGQASRAESGPYAASVTNLGFDAGNPSFGSVGTGGFAYSFFDFNNTIPNGTGAYAIGVAAQGSVNTTGNFLPNSGAGGRGTVEFRLLAPQQVRLSGLFNAVATGNGWLNIVDVQITTAQGGSANGWAGVGSLVSSGPVTAVWPAGIYNLTARASSTNWAPSFGVSGGTGNALAAGGVTVEFLGIVPGPATFAPAAMALALSARRRRR